MATPRTLARFSRISACLRKLFQVDFMGTGRATSVKTDLPLFEGVVLRSHDRKIVLLRNQLFTRKGRSENYYLFLGAALDVSVVPRWLRARTCQRTSGRARLANHTLLPLCQSNKTSVRIAFVSFNHSPREGSATRAKTFESDAGSPLGSMVGTVDHEAVCSISAPMMRHY